MKAKPEAAEAVMRLWQSDDYVIWLSSDLLRTPIPGPVMIAQVTGTESVRAKSVAKQMRAIARQKKHDLIFTNGG